MFDTCHLVHPSKSDTNCAQNKMFYKSVSAENITDYDRWFDRMWKPKSISRISPMFRSYLFLFFDFISFVWWYCWSFLLAFFVCRASSEFHNSMILSIKNCNKTTHSSQILALNSLQLGFHWIFSLSSLEFVQGEIQRPHTPNFVQKMSKNYTPKFAVEVCTLICSLVSHSVPVFDYYIPQWLRYARTSRYWCANTFTCKIIRLYLKAIIIYLHFARINSIECMGWRVGWLLFHRKLEYINVIKTG